MKRTTFSLSSVDSNQQFMLRQGRPFENLQRLMIMFMQILISRSIGLIMDYNF